MIKTFLQQCACPESCDDLNDHGRQPFRLFRLRVSLVTDIDMSDIDAMSDIDGTAMNDIWCMCIKSMHDQISTTSSNCTSNFHECGQRRARPARNPARKAHPASRSPAAHPRARIGPHRHIARNRIRYAPSCSAAQLTSPEHAPGRSRGRCDS